ncbi:MAG: hypothetical protein M1825_000921 [Sarcosagium campestre]|nr:MAG: hypothetical protein M1825_000921 [Sarcosagium campestre]
MRKTGWPPPAREDPLHLFRALTRECSYLFDPEARSYLQSHIASRFRAYRTRDQLHEADDDMLIKINKLHARARKTLSILRRANAGEASSIVHVLHHAYGRSGRRRHHLLKPLLQLDPPNTSEELELTKTPNPQKRGDLTDWPSTSSALRALVSSQCERRVGESIGKLIRRTTPDVPKLNKWGRSLPRKREVNIRERFFKNQLLDNALPPLPSELWHALRARVIDPNAQGAQARRRPIGQAMDSSFHQDDARTQPRKKGVYGKVSTTVDEAVRLSLLGSPPEPCSNEELVDRMNRNPHRLTRRFLSRIYADLFGLCPLMTKSKDDQTWTVRWGDMKDVLELKQPARSITSDPRLFIGAEERGHSLRKVTQ